MSYKYPFFALYSFLHTLLFVNSQESYTMRFIMVAQVLYRLLVMVSIEHFFSLL